TWRTARDWLQSNRDKGMLWNDNPRLPLAREKWNELNELEQKFIKASTKRRTWLRRRRLGWITATVLTVLGIGGYAADQASNAFYARQTRDEIYLGLMERGDFFRINDVLPDNAQGGVLGYDDDSWWNLVRQEEGSFVLGRVYGKGRVMVLGHEALIAYADEYDEALFMEMALYWLVGDGGSAVTFSTLHEEALPIYHRQPYEKLLSRLVEWQFDVDFVEDLADEYSLSETSVLIVGNAWADFTAEEIAAVEKFVDDGGGLLAAGLGWSWVANGDHGLPDSPQGQAALEVYPMNKLMAPYGVRWTNQPFFGRE
ncbi:MAG: hypothetical protein OEQ74_03835, partial [Gammaproteobacteria bacterium]|nr:hypothetical protein [Gammaproteobacteria bacterium]